MREVTRSRALSQARLANGLIHGHGLRGQYARRNLQPVMKSGAAPFRMTVVRISSHEVAFASAIVRNGPATSVVFQQPIE